MLMLGQTGHGEANVLMSEVIIDHQNILVTRKAVLVTPDGKPSEMSVSI